jgi:hypothetical protein
LRGAWSRIWSGLMAGGTGCISGEEDGCELGGCTCARAGGGAVGGEATGEVVFPIGTEASGLGSELDACIGGGMRGAFVVVEGAFGVFPVGDAIKDDTSIGRGLRGHQRCLLEAGKGGADQF